MTVESRLSEAQRLEVGGDMLAAYDVVAEGLATDPTSLDLKHRAVLLLARGGATARARQEYERLGLSTVQDHVDVIALGARLLKDLAIAATGAERRALARESARMYAAAYALGRDHYPGINTATMHLVAGEHAAATAMAAAVLENLNGSGGRDVYYRAASRAEALFILGHIDQAEQALASAIAADPANYAAHASTLRQFEVICATLNLDSAWLWRHSPPPAIMYCGHMFDHALLSSQAGDKLDADIAGALDAARPGAVFGALAAGADIMIARSALARGAELHVVLPMEEASFVAKSVAPFGAGWLALYGDCKAKAATFRVATRQTSFADDAAFAFCSEYAMGLAIRHAAALRTRALQIAVWDGKPGKGIAGTAADVRRWAATERPQTIVSFPPRATTNATSAPDAPYEHARHPKAMLFGDVRGFSKLQESDIAPFVGAVLKPMADALRACPVQPDLVATWGDGIHAVYPTVAAAAAAALVLQDVFARIDLAAAGLPTHLALRVGGHFGPVSEVEDPFMGQRSYYGTHITIAARIEPVAVPGTVYVSEPFAALLALEAPGRYSADYIGQTELPKQFGAMRLFALRSADRLR